MRVNRYPEFHPLMRVWIEIKMSDNDLDKKLMFHPLMRVWIEIELSCVQFTFLATFHPLMRVWIEIYKLGGLELSHIVSPSYEGVD